MRTLLTWQHPTRARERRVSTLNTLRELPCSILSNGLRVRIPGNGLGGRNQHLNRKVITGVSSVHNFARYDRAVLNEESIKACVRVPPVAGQCHTTRWWNALPTPEECFDQQRKCLFRCEARIIRAGIEIPAYNHRHFTNFRVQVFHRGLMGGKLTRCIFSFCKIIWQ